MKYGLYMNVVLLDLGLGLCLDLGFVGVCVGACVLVTKYSLYKCTVYTVHCTVYILQCTVYTIHCTVNSLHCAMYFMQIERGFMYTVLLYSVYCNLLFNFLPIYMYIV